MADIEIHELSTIRSRPKLLLEKLSFETIPRPGFVWRRCPLAIHRIQRGLG